MSLQASASDVFYRKRRNLGRRHFLNSSWQCTCSITHVPSSAAYRRIAALSLKRGYWLLIVISTNTCNTVTMVSIAMMYVSRFICEGPCLQAPPKLSISGDDHPPVSRRQDKTPGSCQFVTITADLICVPWSAFNLSPKTFKIKVVGSECDGESAGASNETLALLPV